MNLSSGRAARIRLLGGVQVTSSDGVDLTRRIRRRPLATLLVLAGGGERGVSRENLITLLWPDYDPDRGRNNLSQALYALRRELGEGAIVATPSGVQLSPARFSVDLWEFQKAYLTRDYERAVGHYGGSFVDGFSVPGLEEFERWMHSRRASLSAKHRQSLRSLAEAAEAAGERSSALRWWREAAHADPLSALGATGLMRALAAAGDRPGALEHERRYRARVQLELGAEPDPSVTLLAQELRRGSGEAAAARTPLSWRARLASRAAVALTVVAALLLLVSVARRWGGRDAGEDPTGPARLAVLPFQVTGSTAVAPLGTGVAGLLASSLDGAGPMRALPPAAVLEVSGNGKELTSRRAAGYARRLHADLYVVGEIVEAGGKLRVSATMFDRAAGATPVARGSVEGSPADLLALSDALAQALITDQFRDPADRLLRSATSSASSLPAMKAYLRGEGLFRDGRYADAMDAFARAVRADSTFALALFRESVSADLAGRDVVAERAAAQALALRDRLSEHDARFVEAYAAWREGDDDRAERMLRDLAGDYESDPQAWLTLGMVVVQSNPLHGRSALEARDAFERALAIAPNDAEAMLALARLADLAGDHVRSDSLIARIASLQGRPVMALRSMRAFAFGDRPGVKPGTRYLLANEETLPARTALEVAGHVGDVAAIERLSRALLSGTGPDPDNPGRRMLARVALAQGRPAAADSELVGGPQSGTTSAITLRALHAAYDFLPVSEARTQEIRRVLRTWQPAPPTIQSADVYADLVAQVRLHRIGLLSVRLGDLPAARSAADSIDRLGGAEDRRALGPMLANSVRAHVAFAEGRPQEALDWLDRARWALGADLFEAEANDRWLRAKALAAVGRERDALAWYATLGQRSASEVVYLAPAALAQAEILDRLGDPLQAARQYRRFLALWGAADAELMPIVERARSRLREIEAPKKLKSL